MNERITGAAYAAGWKLVRVLPGKPVLALFRTGAGWFAGRGGAGPRRLSANLRRVVPDASEAELADLTKRGLQSYARYWHEAFRLPDWSHEEIQRRFVLENASLLDDAVARGHGALVALPHAANWDLAGAWATIHGIPVTTVAERLKPEDLYQRFLSFRRALGMEILPLTGGGRPPLDVLTERVREGRVVVLLADRDLSARGVEVDFFGERTKMPAGPAVLALRTGAPLFGLALWNDGPITRARLIPVPVEADPTDEHHRDPERVAAVTQLVADALASGIAEHPVDWHMLQPLWLADLPPRRRRTAAVAD
ncbi:phosphatidylinositol mannoside acyltransferase [Cryptosporangium sp. NPDC051539]|uniref:phosphatidylinositol mannoside acyltransferase n=1 Tax=Cryptosporangium sp. NPDC051539 TaxID=3363962 RepID=UPI0037B16974